MYGGLVDYYNLACRGNIATSAKQWIYILRPKHTKHNLRQLVKLKVKTDGGRHGSSIDCLLTLLEIAYPLLDGRNPIIYDNVGYLI